MSACKDKQELRLPLEEHFNLILRVIMTSYLCMTDSSREETLVRRIKLCDMIGGKLNRILRM